jgi:hypothetical protein
VNNDRGFRPESAAGASVVARLWRAAQSLAAAELRSLETNLSAALAIDDDETHYRGPGMLTVLTRPDGSRGNAAEHFTRDLVSTVNLACQYVTCVAHYGDYYKYPIVLMTAVVDDIHGVLTELETTLNLMGDIHPAAELELRESG